LGKGRVALIVTEGNYAVDIVKSAEEQEAVYSVRMVVFVEEQKVPVEEELDAYDITATHFFVRHLPSPLPAIIGTARLLDKGAGTGKVGRVAICIEHRGQGAGALLMRAVEQIARQRGFQELILEAQVTALGFYAKLGYVAEGELFYDCAILHQLMRKRLG
jgi:predicted GNAT family N-acyltransferase